MYLMLLILLKVFARFFFKNERRAREGGQDSAEHAELAEDIDKESR